MKKQLMLLSAAALVGYITLTAFGGATKAEQLADIQTKVKMGLDELRTAEKAKCDARVAEAVSAKLAEMASAVPEPAPALAGKGGAKKPATKKPATPPTATPVPQPTTPSNPKQQKMEEAPNTQQKQDKMAPAPAPNTDKKKQKMEGGGGGN
jgi:outer membrane biosynthesis protein TonB